MNDKTILGYSSGDMEKPVYKPMPGQLATAAIILCSQCDTMISGSMGPHRDTWCIQCTENKE